MPPTDPAAKSAYWAELSHNGRILGGGLLVQRGGVILTAAHCLRSLPPGEEQLNATLGSGLKLRVRVEEIVDWDLALLVALDPEECEIPPPHADAGREKDKWFAPYRPASTDPYLGGLVVVEDCAYELTDGTEVAALQLGVDEQLGDYSGYSGGPVEAERNGQPRLVGVLLEQYPDRADPGRFSNVLFAAQIHPAVLRFRRFDITNLFPGAATAQPPRKASPDADTVVGERLRKLRAWRETEVITSRTAKVMELRILEDWLRGAPGEESR